MMVSETETASIRRFVCGQLCDEPDLSVLTLGILKKRYMALVRCESLSPEVKTLMKQVVQEELMKMQDDDKNESQLENKKFQKKRKREKETDEMISSGEDESTAKKSRCQSSSSSESGDKEDRKREGEESEEEEKMKSDSEDEKQEVKKSQQKKNGNRKQQISSEDSTDEEMNESEKEDNKNGDSPKAIAKNQTSNAKNGHTEGSKISEGKKTPQSDEENDTDTDNASERNDKIKGSDSSDESEKEKVSVEKKNNDPDSDSSSLPSLEDEQDGETEKTQDNKKKKTASKEKSGTGQKDDNKTVVRLKRYISLCGVRRNYKKLLDGCRSVRSQVAALRKELEDLGVRGQPSIEKCKKVRMKREEAQELAELDVSNIIATQGRSKRRATSAWQEQQDPSSSTYVRTLNSGSDSDQENDTQRRHRKATNWANLQGIISDDADSD